MKFTFTIKELETITDKKLICALITERQSTLNMYSLLNKRLNELKSTIKSNINLDNWIEDDGNINICRQCVLNLGKKTGIKPVQLNKNHLCKKCFTEINNNIY